MMSSGNIILKLKSLGGYLDRNFSFVISLALPLFTFFYYFITLLFSRFCTLFLVLVYFICSRYKPDVIKGDMDSIRPEVQEFYTKLVCSPCSLVLKPEIFIIFDSM